MPEMQTAADDVVKRKPGRPKGSGAGNANPPRKKPGQRNKFSIATMGRDVRLGLLISLNYGGQRWPVGMAPPPNIAPNAIDFWLKLKRNHPQKYAECLMKLIPRDVADEDTSLRIIVQQINVTAGPVPGVISSPVLEHVAPLKLVANGEGVTDG